MHAHNLWRSPKHNSAALVLSVEPSAFHTITAAEEPTTGWWSSIGGYQRKAGRQEMRQDGDKMPTMHARLWKPLQVLGKSRRWAASPRPSGGRLQRAGVHYGFLYQQYFYYSLSFYFNVGKMGTGVPPSRGLDSGLFICVKEFLQVPV